MAVNSALRFFVANELCGKELGLVHRDHGHPRPYESVLDNLRRIETLPEGNVCCQRTCGTYRVQPSSHRNHSFKPVHMYLNHFHIPSFVLVVVKQCCTVT